MQNEKTTEQEQTGTSCSARSRRARAPPVLPARPVYLYSGGLDGHAICEVHVDGDWQLVDALIPHVYVDPEGRPLGVARLLAATADERQRWLGSIASEFAAPRMFAHVAVAEYRLADAARYDYSLSRVNDFYRELLRPQWNP